MMRALLEAEKDHWLFGESSEELELHDVQFMLCELQKFEKRDKAKGRGSLRDRPGLGIPMPVTTTCCPRAPILHQKI